MQLSVENNAHIAKDFEAFGDSLASASEKLVIGEHPLTMSNYSELQFSTQERNYQTHS